MWMDTGDGKMEEATGLGKSGDTGEEREEESEMQCLGFEPG